MNLRQLGQNGPKVSALGLGCLSFGGMFGPTKDSDSLTAMDAAWDMGITFFDSANIYGLGRSETVIGDWMRRRKRRPVLATKAGILTGPVRGVDNSEDHLRRELAGSFRRLGVDYVDLFYIHRHEKTRPIEDVAETMGRLITEGKIGGWGLSEVAPYTLRRAHAVTPVTAVQNEFSLWSRAPELGLIQECARLGVAFVPFSPVARGVFGREMFEPTALMADDFRRQIPRFSDENWPRSLTHINQFRALCADLGVTPPALALAWVLAKGDHLLPIPGSRRADHILDWAGALDITMTPDLILTIDAVLPVGWAYGDRYSDDQATSVERYS